ncbi:hypothetical protein OROGR_018033 [Orobanche gracilis]
MLKEELRNMERTQKREGVDLTYLKNVILKLLETGEVERLLPVVAMLLQFSPDEQCTGVNKPIAPQTKFHLALRAILQDLGGLSSLDSHFRNTSAWSLGKTQSGLTVL